MLFVFTKTDLLNEVQTQMELALARAPLAVRLESLAGATSRQRIAHPSSNSYVHNF